MIQRVSVGVILRPRQRILEPFVETKLRHCMLEDKISGSEAQRPAICMRTKEPRRVMFLAAPLALPKSVRLVVVGGIDASLLEMVALIACLDMSEYSQVL
jgi:hypothetical protein